jgi:hypothetical protein
MMTLAVHADRSCLVITCHTCAPVDGRRVELNLPLGRSREAMAAMKSHADDCHRR